MCQAIQRVVPERLLEHYVELVTKLRLNHDRKCGDGKQILFEIVHRNNCGNKLCDSVIAARTNHLTCSPQASRSYHEAVGGHDV